MAIFNSYVKLPEGKFLSPEPNIEAAETQTPKLAGSRSFRTHKRANSQGDLSNRMHLGEGTVRCHDFDR